MLPMMTFRTPRLTGSRPIGVMPIGWSSAGRHLHLAQGSGLRIEDAASDLVVEGEAVDASHVAVAAKA